MLQNLGLMEVHLFCLYTCLFFLTAGLERVDFFRKHFNQKKNYKLISFPGFLNAWWMLQNQTIGSFGNDDGDGNQDVKKAIVLLRKTTTRFFVHFFTVLARLRRENAYLQVLWRT